MKRTLLVSHITVLLFVLSVSGVALAQADKWRSGSKARVSGAAAVLETLLEDQDSLNMISAGHTKQLGELKERIKDLEERLKKAEAEAGQAKEGAEQAKESVESVAEDVSEVKSRFVDGDRKIPKFIPHFEFRVRPEYTTNRTDMDSDWGDEDLFYAQRVRLGATLQPVEGVSGTVVIQDSRTWGEEPSTTTSIDGLDLFEGYLLLTDLWTPGLDVQVGRFQMAFGSERQIGKTNWGNGRVFDGFRLSYFKPKTIGVDAFATILRDSREADGENMDFYGLYLSTDALDFMDIELYGLYLHNATKNARERIGTVGARAEARPVKGLLLEAEAAVQFGKVDASLATGIASIDHLATMYGAVATYEFQVKTSPTLGVFFDSASGDANPWDDSSVAYRTLFPTGHRFYGSMDLFSRKGIWDIGPTFMMKPVEELLLRVDYHLFNLSSDGGTLRDVFGGVTTFAAGSGKFIGHEIDIMVRWAAMKWLTLQAGYSLFVPGGATRAAIVEHEGGTIKVGEDMAHWAYFMAIASF